MSEFMRYAEETYSLVRRPTTTAKKALDATVAETVDYWHAVGLGTPRVLFARGLDGHLARFIEGSASAGKPIVVVDYDFARTGSDDDLEITLFHELVHAFYDSAYAEEERLDPEAEEVVAEQVATELWTRGIDPGQLRAYLEAIVEG